MLLLFIYRGKLLLYIFFIFCYILFSFLYIYIFLLLISIFFTFFFLFHYVLIVCISFICTIVILNFFKKNTSHSNNISAHKNNIHLAIGDGMKKRANSKSHTGSSYMCDKVQVSSINR